MNITIRMLITLCLSNDIYVQFKKIQSLTSFYVVNNESKLILYRLGRSSGYFRSKVQVHVSFSFVHTKPNHR